MKKIMGGLLVVPVALILLGGCSSGDSGETTASLETQVSELKTENSDLKKKVSAYENVLGIGDDESEEASASSEDNSSSSDVETYGIGETLSVGDGEKSTAEITITNASTAQSAFPEHMISLDDYDTTKMVAVTIEYKNVAMEEAFLPQADYFQAFSKDGTALEQVSQQSGQDEVAVGRTGKTTLYWELTTDASQFNEMEIDFIPSSEKIATFDVVVTH